MSLPIPKSLLSTFSKTSTQTIASAAAPALSALDVVNAWKEYVTTCEIEETKREAIRADRDVQITSIKEQGKVWRAFIENTFAERREVFSKSFDMLENALNNGDDKEINAALAMITEQIKISPMKQAAEMMLAMSDPDVKHIEV